MLLIKRLKIVGSTLVFMSIYRKYAPPVLTAFIIALIAFSGFPASYGLIIIGFVWIRRLDIQGALERKIIRAYPAFESHHPFVQKAIPFVFYVILLISLKFIIVDIAIEGLLNIPVREEFQSFVDSSMQE